MSNTSAAADTRPWAGPGPREFIALIAALMATNALAIDMMLPALPAIGTALDVDSENTRQLVITMFIIGFGGAQLFYGPFSDRFGRKRILTFSLICYALCATLSALAQSFTLLLAARLLHGIAAAGSRVLVASIVRDRFHGAAMARVMSFAMIIFLLVPILAPSIGQLVLTVAGWRIIFLLLAVYAGIVLIWSAFRLPETLAVENRRPLTLAKVGEAFTLTLTHRTSIGNNLALSLMFGALFGFINSVQQIVFDVFGQGERIGLTFAAIAGPMAISSYLNTRIVERFGARAIMLIGLCAFVAIAGLHVALDLLSSESLLRFTILQALGLACLGVITANMGSIAMQPLGHVAGTASSVQGFITTLGGALIGLAIGQAFDGTTMPLVAGSFLCGVIALALALWANRSGHEAAPVEAGIGKGAA